MLTSDFRRGFALNARDIPLNARDFTLTPDIVLVRSVMSLYAQPGIYAQQAESFGISIYMHLFWLTRGSRYKMAKATRLWGTEQAMDPAPRQGQPPRLQAMPPFERTPHGASEAKPKTPGQGTGDFCRSSKASFSQCRAWRMTRLARRRPESTSFRV